MKILGREQEQRIIETCMKSGKPELLTVSGRLGIGKTYLITQYFSGKFAFHMAGQHGKGMKEQLLAFKAALEKHFGSSLPSTLKNWRQAFEVLGNCLKQDTSRSRKVLFFDEISWADTQKSGFTRELRSFIESYALRDGRAFVIACSSDASIFRMLQNPGGSDISASAPSESLTLRPFNLYECEQFFAARGAKMSLQQIFESYMIFGGIPYYLEELARLAQQGSGGALPQLLKSGYCKDEYGRLCGLFRLTGNHISILQILTEHDYGLTRQELSACSGISDGGGLTSILTDMESYSIMSRCYGHKKKKGSDIYKIADMFMLFCFMNPEHKGCADAPDAPAKPGLPAQGSAWHRAAFSRLCVMHAAQVKQKLGIAGVITDNYSYRSKEQNPDTYINLVIDRADNIINLCRCVYSPGEYILTERDILQFLKHRNTFRQEANTNKALRMTIITPYGLAQGGRSGDIQWQITLSDLSAPEAVV